MTYLIIAFFGLLIISLLSFLKEYEFILLLSIVFTIILAVSITIGGLMWKASSVKMKIINREFGTKYTVEEIFYASDVINTIRELDRQRIEINGNLMQK